MPNVLSSAPEQEWIPIPGRHFSHQMKCTPTLHLTSNPPSVTGNTQDQNGQFQSPLDSPPTWAWQMWFPYLLKMAACPSHILPLLPHLLSQDAGQVNHSASRHGYSMTLRSQNDLFRGSKGSLLNSHRATTQHTYLHK